MRHEAVAYLNRMGQFHSFARSRFVEEVLGDGESLLPSFRTLKIFRDKHAAHRSMDDPRRAERDDPSIAFDHALSLGPYGAEIRLTPEATNRFRAMMRGASDWGQALLDFNNKHLGSDDYEAAFEIFDGTTKTYVTFVFERDHEAICSEAYRLLQMLLTWSAN
jgi:hypothetical protein